MRAFLKLLCAALILGMMALTGGAGCADGSKTVSSKQEGSYFIRVSTRKNRVTVYRKDNGKWKKLDTKRCSTGALLTPTPKGLYKIKKKKFTFYQYGQNWYYATYFYKDYAIHSTGATGGKFDNSTLGKSTSHGCVRLKPKDAKWIYNHIPTGTYIQID